MQDTRRIGMYKELEKWHELQAGLESIRSYQPAEGSLVEKAAAYRVAGEELESGYAALEEWESFRRFCRERELRPLLEETSRLAMEKRRLLKKARKALYREADSLEQEAYKAFQGAGDKEAAAECCLVYNALGKEPPREAERLLARSHHQTDGQFSLAQYLLSLEAPDGFREALSPGLPWEERLELLEKSLGAADPGFLQGLREGLERGMREGYLSRKIAANAELRGSFERAISRLDERLAA